MQKPGCRFCNPPERDRIVLDSANFYVMVSLGALTEGHLMVIPKSHISCSGDMPDELSAEFERQSEIAQSALSSVYGSSFFFEHGRSGSCMPEGHGEDHCFHAHVHFLPIKTEMAARVAAAVKNDYAGHRLVKWSDVREQYRQTQEPYVLVEDGEAIHFAVTPAKIPRHYLRSVVAEFLNVPEYSDWVAAPNYQIIAKTIDRLNGAGLSGQAGG